MNYCQTECQDRHICVRNRHNRGFLSFGGWTVLAIAVVSSLVLLILAIVNRGAKEPAVEFWTFAQVHEKTYSPEIDKWNEGAQSGEQLPVEFLVVEGNALVSRTLSAAWAGTPVADMMEVERGQVGSFFTGPIEDVPFADLTDRLHDEGIYDMFPPQAFSLWSSRGRIFGLPHDIHPVVLAYRHDILLEEYGITPEAFEASIETWEDFVRVTKPLVRDLDGDGVPDRYPLGIWYTESDQLELLLSQANGGAFDSEGRPTINSETNAMVLAHLVSWCIGPNRIAINAPNFQDGGNQMRREGEVLCAIMPDWLAGVFKVQLPSMAGQWRIMPLPAWEPGGRRTSVWGGTMLSITKSSENFEDAWAFAKHLYLSRELAERLYDLNSIVTPVRDHWDLEIYQRPEPYFADQRIGQLFIDLIPEVPVRVPSPFRNVAQGRFSLAIAGLYRYGRVSGETSFEALNLKAQELLDDQQRLMESDMARNVFLRGDDDENAGSPDNGESRE